ncbi:MAG: GGDEF domain-containing protein [Acholeplasmataceae bacterium]|nr:GGDEF domain-containing protein [Acholeplasmataceae bacterium]
MTKLDYKESLIMAFLLIAILIASFFMINNKRIEDANELAIKNSNEVCALLTSETDRHLELIKAGTLSLTEYDLAFDETLFTEIQIGLPKDYNLNLAEEFLIIYYNDDKIFYEPFLNYLAAFEQPEKYFVVVDDQGKVLSALGKPITGQITSHINNVSAFDKFFQTKEAFSYLDKNEFVTSSPLSDYDYFLIQFTAKSYYLSSYVFFLTVLTLVVVAIVVAYVLIFFYNKMIETQVKGELNLLMVNDLSYLYLIEIDKKGKIIDQNKLFENLIHRQEVSDIYSLLEAEVDLKEVTELELKVSNQIIKFDKYNYRNRYILLAEKFTSVIKEQDYIIHYHQITGLPNEASFIKYMESLDKHVKSVIIALDIKKYSITKSFYGEMFVNELVKMIANYFKSVLPENKYQLFLIKEDTFVIVTADDIMRDTKVWIYNLIQDLNAFLAANKSIQVAFSVAITSTTKEILMEPNNVAHYLMLALKRAKDNERNEIAFYDEDLKTYLNERDKVIKDLEYGIDNDEFEIYLQPKLRVKDRKITSFEALMRWNNPAYFFVSPDRYFTLAEETNLIYLLTDITINQTAKLIKEANDKNMIVSFNASPEQLLEQGFISKIVKAVKKEKIEYNQIAIEITETVFSKSFNKVVEKVNAIKKLGVKIYLDDFGSGYSSLKYLNDLAIDALKIDRSFIFSMCDDKRVEAIVKTIIDLAHNLNLFVIAEGVETKAQLAILEKYKCDYIQGFIVSKAIVGTEAIAMFNKKVDI